MSDQAEFRQAKRSLSGININDLALGLRGTDSKPDPHADLYQRMGLRTADSLLGLVSEESKYKKYSIPEPLVKAVTDLDDDDFDTRQRASRVLREKASLKDLVDIRYRVEDLTSEQRHRLNLLIQASAEKMWKDCDGDPRKLGKEVRDGKIAEALIAHAPPDLKHCLETEREFREFMSTPHTVKEYRKALDKLGRIAVFTEMVEKSAAKDDAEKATKDLAASHKQRSIWHHAKAFAMDIDHQLANADSKHVVDSENISKEDRQRHAQSSRATYLEIIDSKKYDVFRNVFWQHTHQFLCDKTIDDKLYVDTVRKLTDKAISESFDHGPPGSNADSLFLLLGQCNEPLSKTKQKELDKQFERLSIVMEARLANIKDPEALLRHQKSLIEMYLRSRHREKSGEKATAMFARAAKTIELLPKDQWNEELRALAELRKFGERLK